MEVEEISSKEQYTESDVVEFIETAAPDSADVLDTHHSIEDVHVDWHGGNRIDVFTHLAERGWIVTSVDPSGVWLEQLE